MVIGSPNVATAVTVKSVNGEAVKVKKKDLNDWRMTARVSQATFWQAKGVRGDRM